MILTKRPALLMIVLLGLLWAIPSQAMESDSISDDPYLYYQDLFWCVLSDESRPKQDYIAAKEKAWEIFSTVDEDLREDYQFFRWGNDSVDDFENINPFFIAYIFSQQYSDDPRYGLDFLITKADERIAEQEFISKIGDFQTEIRIIVPGYPEPTRFSCIFSFPHLVLGYRGEEAVPYLMQEWLDRSAADDESYHYFEYALRASGVEALPYIKQALMDEELNKKQGWTLVYLLNEMIGSEIYRIIPGTPYVLDDDGRGEVWQFWFDYFFEHPYELSGRAALAFLVGTEFEPDTDRLIEFLKVEKDRGALFKAIHLLRRHVTKDDERLLELIPAVTGWLSDAKTLDTGTSFIGMLTEYWSVQLEEPYASAFYPPLYETFMTPEDEGLLWVVFYSLYMLQDKIYGEWGAVEIERMLKFMMEFGDSPDYIYMLNELSQRNKFDLSFYVGDIVRFIPQPIEYEEIEDVLDSVGYYLDILVYISTENPDVINDNLKQIHDRLTTWVGQTDLDSYASIIINLENAGIAISPDLRELE